MNDGRTFAVNRRARYDYEIIDSIEAGLSLLGTEIKAMREGRATIAEAYGKAICIHTGEPVKNWTNLPLYPYADDDGSSGFLQISCEGNGIPSTQNDELWYKIDDEANKILGTRMGDGLYWNETQNAASIHVFKD